MGNCRYRVPLVSSVWVHHFFTMGNGALINSFFSISTMLIGIPTGVKLFNWLLTLYKGRITFESPMLFSLAFIPNFLLGGVTGVMLAMASADYQYHNTYFFSSSLPLYIGYWCCICLLSWFNLLVSKDDGLQIKRNIKQMVLLVLHDRI